MNAFAEKEDMFAKLTMKLAGFSLDKPPRKKSDFNTWANATPGVREDAKAEGQAAKVPGKQRGAARQTIVRLRFKKLPKAERDEWELESLRVQKEKKKEQVDRLKEPPSKDPEDRQLYVPSFFGLDGCSSWLLVVTQSH